MTAKPNNHNYQNVYKSIPGSRVFGVLSSTSGVLPSTSITVLPDTEKDAKHQPVGVRLGGEDLNFSNIQRDQWIRAKECFNEEVKRNPSPRKESLLNIAAHLANSLSAVFSAVLECEGNVPSLRGFVEKLKADKGWDIENDMTGTISFIEDISKYHNAVKHHGKNKHSFYDVINKETVTDFMEKTQHIWKWIMVKDFGEKHKTTPEDRLKEFKENFRK